MAKSTKVCHKCKDDKMISLHSVDKKICPTCRNVIKWDLQEGQKAVFGDKK